MSQLVLRCSCGSRDFSIEQNHDYQQEKVYEITCNECKAEFLIDLVVSDDSEVQNEISIIKEEV